MIERRCSACEALIEIDECYDCLVYADIRFYKSRMLPERKMSEYCRKGHRMTSENIGERVRLDRDGPRTTRICLLCKKERNDRRIRSQVGIIRKRR